MEKELPILVCEDDAEMRETLSDILSDEGYVVKTTGKGEEALALAEEKKPPICLIDLKLPDISGIEVLKGLKALNSETAAIIITAFASKETAIEALKAGAYCYIEKPLDIAKLLAAIERAYDTYRLREDKRRAEEEREQLIKELEAKNAEMERFVYTVSHDLRTPLITLQGFASMLRTDLGESKTKEVEVHLKNIETSATKMECLLHETLELSRIGRVTNPPEDVPFGEIVQEALEQTLEQIKSSGVETSVAAELPTVHVDRMRIVEVLVNLIANSINYMGEQAQPNKLHG
jgi:FixJ family two-component response regulator